jgi:type I restriction enzyme, R subunit
VAQQSLLDEVASDQWWVDVTLPMLEVVRRRLCGLLQFLEKAKKAVVYTSFQDELSEATLVELPGITPGTNWQRFRAKAAAYLKQHVSPVGRMSQEGWNEPDPSGCGRGMVTFI